MLRYYYWLCFCRLPFGAEVLGCWEEMSVCCQIQTIHWNGVREVALLGICFWDGDGDGDGVSGWCICIYVCVSVYWSNRPMNEETRAFLKD